MAHGPMNADEEIADLKAEVKFARDMNQVNFQDAVNLRRERDAALARDAELEARLAKFEAFARAHEMWEAKVVMEADSGISSMPTWMYQGMMDMQQLRNEAMGIRRGS